MGLTNQKLDAIVLLRVARKNVWEVFIHKLILSISLIMIPHINYVTTAGPVTVTHNRNNIFFVYRQLQVYLIIININKINYNTRTNIIKYAFRVCLSIIKKCFLIIYIFIIGLHTINNQYSIYAYVLEYHEKRVSIIIKIVWL